MTILQNQPAHKQDIDNSFLFIILSTLTFFFILIEISFFVQSNQAYLADFSFVSDKIKLPATIIPGVLKFIAAQLSLHVIFLIITYALTTLLCDLTVKIKKYKLSIGITVWFLCMSLVFLANQYFFPNSKFALLSGLIFKGQALNTAFIATLFIFSMILLLASISLIIKVVTHVYYYSFSVLFLMFLVAILFHPNQLKVTDGGTEKQPNIILVGVDSLRPDFLGYFNDERVTPFLDSLLNKSLVFTESVTPLARTFPSWTAVLSGQYPKQTGIRSNLAKQNAINFNYSLPAILQRQGYETVYATDETRFSNISTNYAFNKIITPPVGINDFLLGTFNDFPISNLIVNTKLGAWLFPYSYANRAVYFTYSPNSFIEFMRPMISTNRKRPMFLAAHFCLPHHPYLWSDYVVNNNTKDSVPQLYEASVKRVDEQLKNFFSMLTEAKMLDHAIVVVLSDHGEALELPGDRITDTNLYENKKSRQVPKFYPSGLDNESINKSAGHGTDVLGLSQYHTLLAFKLYGLGDYKIGAVPGVVSLLDIKPTILGLLNIKSDLQQTFKVSGDSLAGIVRGTTTVIPSQPIFLESDFSPEAIRTVYPQTRKVLLEGINLFEVDPVTTRLTVKNSMAEMILRSKQYATIYKGWMLASYPQNHYERTSILVNLTTGEWTNDLRSTLAMHSPVSFMQTQMNLFYGKELI